MTKKWKPQDVDFALDSAWSAFLSTLKLHGVTQEQVDKLSDSVGSFPINVYSAFCEVIYGTEED